MRCNKIWQYFWARLHIIYINSKPTFLGCKGRSGGRSYGDGTRSKLVGQFPSFVAIFFLTTEICGRPRKQLIKINFAGKPVLKIILYRVDSRVQHVWRLQVIGSWWRYKICISVFPKILHAICIGNSMICSDIWHKYHKGYFEILIRNFTSR